ncbi:ethanolamine kinase [Anaeramoeba flamelloides]|uniref:Ethanolamine kinase n=1 Tax=Anaeramoeba flamelloides TaxID=1746091 RepID=A0AAV8A3W1_9EUKA|nr:ethanolamine kinase [Anaeramoeba flamelloides]
MELSSIIKYPYHKILLNVQDPRHLINFVNNLNVPNWKCTEITSLSIEKLCGGIANTAYKISCETKSVTLRLSGFETNKEFDQFKNIEIEFLMLDLLSKMGLAPILYARTLNGSILEYYKGRKIKLEEMRSAMFQKKIASKFVQLHTLSFEMNKKFKITCWHLFKEYTTVIKTHLVEESEILHFQKIEKLVLNLKQLVKKTIQSDLCICHNDLNYSNIIINPKTKEVKFIDFEFCAINNPWFDLGNHLVQYCSKDTIIELLPTNKEITTFLQFYLLEKESSLDRINFAVYASRLFMLLATLLWGCWGQMMFFLSNLNNDYPKYYKQKYKVAYYLLDQLRKEFGAKINF